MPTQSSHNSCSLACLPLLVTYPVDRCQRTASDETPKHFVVIAAQRKKKQNNQQREKKGYRTLNPPRRILVRLPKSNACIYCECMSVQRKTIDSVSLGTVSQVVDPDGNNGSGGGGDGEIVLRFSLCFFYCRQQQQQQQMNENDHTTLARGGRGKTAIALAGTTGNPQGILFFLEQS